METCQSRDTRAQVKRITSVTAKRLKADIFVFVLNRFLVKNVNGRHLLSPNRFQTFEYLDTVFGAVKISADGFKTYKKVPTAYLVTHWISVFLGVAECAWIFLAGVVSVVRFRTKMLRQPEAPAFVTIVLLVSSLGSTITVRRWIF
jgi:hypothetical protein